MWVKLLRCICLAELRSAEHEIDFILLFLFIKNILRILLYVVVRFFGNFFFGFS
ncbi:hypothetical protein XF_2296 [Xylella fastidiosa 9a5c]|uniref:Uncharacterized protein n=1 Tax=Xylella fastidiosa (strain 9a5c) TaxID=160492 RepID=Q9PB49_XYLFA|nr:hypothetical protein XF_2296 [Xylella fastidiosa 9a5c]